MICRSKLTTASVPKWVWLLTRHTNVVVSVKLVCKYDCCVFLKVKVKANIVCVCVRMYVFKKAGKREQTQKNKVI